jgi:hypothetical protein
LSERAPSRIGMQCRRDVLQAGEGPRLLNAGKAAQHALDRG